MKVSINFSQGNHKSFTLDYETEKLVGSKFAGFPAFLKKDGVVYRLSNMDKPYEDRYIIYYQSIGIADFLGFIKDNNFELIF